MWDVIGVMDIKKIVKDRIAQLLELAERNVKRNPQRSRRYVQLALRLSMRHKVGIPKRFKRSFCKRCYRYWVPGYNVRIIIDRRNKTICYVCACGKRRCFKYK